MRCWLVAATANPVVRCSEATQFAMAATNRSAVSSDERRLDEISDMNASLACFDARHVTLILRWFEIVVTALGASKKLLNIGPG